jgi:hypothetical protein
MRLDTDITCHGNSRRWLVNNANVIMTSRNNEVNERADQTNTHTHKASMEGTYGAIVNPIYTSTIIITQA